MRFDIGELTSVLKERIRNYEAKLDVSETGVILEIGDGIAHIYGLDNAMASEMIEFPNGSYGVVFNLEEDSVGVIILGEYEDLREGQEVRRTGRVLEVPVGEALLGRVVDPLGRPLDGKGEIKTD